MGDDGSESKDVCPYQALEVGYDQEDLPIETLEEHIFLLHRVPVKAIEQMAHSLEYTGSPVPFTNVDLMVQWEPGAQYTEEGERYFSHSPFGLWHLLEENRDFFVGEDIVDEEIFEIFEKVRDQRNVLLLILGQERPIFLYTEREDYLYREMRVSVANHLERFARIVTQLFDEKLSRYEPKKVYELAVRERQKAVNKLANISNRNGNVITNRDEVMIRNLEKSIEGYERFINNSEPQLN